MPRRYHPVQLETFVLRIWREASGSAWRGEIIHLPDRVARRFGTLAQAGAFIATYAPGVDQPIDEQIDNPAAEDSSGDSTTDY
ncbi:MAG: hypothetical protein RMN25_05850 [Anaerolineae bacterium]|nr:hypothetical protein [Thermoflexales bacterium]MDW8407289.1 hypothetical protein [Anaerolineae bacterium]